MILGAILSQYISHKRALGYRFQTEDAILRSFCRCVGDQPLAQVGPQEILSFLDGNGPVTAYWEKKYRVLSGLYRFALARGCVVCIPLPRTVAVQTMPAFVPYIYSRAELKRLLEAVPAACSSRARIDADVFRTVLLLLYGAALRLSEAISLGLDDVDLPRACLRVRGTKFYKTRDVPLGADLTQVLSDYVRANPRLQSAAATAPLFCLRDGTALTKSCVQSAFRRLRITAGIVREGGPRRQPRLHDLRHTAAVHRLVAWYRSGADLNDLLPKLATYLGHVDLSSTQRYLTMTADLLHEASLRFERYALEHAHE